MFTVVIITLVNNDTEKKLGTARKAKIIWFDGQFLTICHSAGSAILIS